MKTRNTITIFFFVFNLFLTPIIHSAEIRLIPIQADGVHGIIDQEIRLVGGGQRVIIEIGLSGWDPDMDGNPRLASYQATIDSCEYSQIDAVCIGGNRNGKCCVEDVQCNPDGFCEDPGTLVLPAFESCTMNSDCDPSFAPGATCIRMCIGGDNNGVLCTSNAGCPGGGICSASFCRPGFVDISRPDFIFFGIGGSIADVAINSLNYSFGGLLFSDSILDDGTTFYGGTLVLDVPLGAIGSYTITLSQGLGQSFLADLLGTNLLPLDIVPTIITVVCESNTDCNDGNLCTSDVCNAEGNCLHENNYDDTVSCCNQDSGATTPLDDGNECTDNICNTDGSVDHPPLSEFTSCGNPASSDCDKPDSCDGAGNCSTRLEPFGSSCGDPTNTDCNGADLCDGGGTCLANLADAGTPCGDTGDTQCDNPDSCNALGSCLSNHESDGTICDDGLFCTLDDACFSGQCSDNTPRDCDDGLDCTTDVCIDENNMCESTLNSFSCLIDSICYADGNLDPSNDCMECNSLISTEAWTPLENGSPCNDGDPCTGTGRPDIGVDSCTDGVCAGITDKECNDDCAFAIEALEGTTLSNNSSAGADDGEASCQPDSNNDIWFVYTAPCDTTIFVSTSGSVMKPSNDPVLNVFDACPDDGGIEIACDDDSGINLQSALIFSATGGVSYFIRVAGFEDNAGTVALNIDLFNDCLINGVCHAGGSINPESSCEECNPDISTTSWTPLTEGSSCGSSDTTECDNPDACDGLGVCETNNKPDGIICSDDGNECTMNFCNGGICSHPPEASGFSCGDPTDTECDKPDSCDGNSICLDNFEETGFACGDPTNTQCDLFDVCDGQGSCTENLAPDGTKCDDSDVCTGNDACDTGLCFGVAISEAPTVNGFGPRNISVTPLPVGSPAPVSLRITSPDWPCLDMFIDSDGSLSTDPVVQLPDEWSTIHLRDPNIVPDSTYQIEAICGEFTTFSTSGMTAAWGDVNLSGTADLIDVFIIVDGWKGIFTLPLEVLDLTPCIPDIKIDIRDIQVAVDAWKGFPYPCPVPCP